MNQAVENIYKFVYFPVQISDHFIYEIFKEYKLLIRALVLLFT